jgi:hypothetical protein
MDIRLPMPKAAAQVLKGALADKGLSVTHAQALELIARVYGYNDWHSMNHDDRFKAPSVLKAKASDEYSMGSEPGTSCWLTVDSVSVRIAATGMGVEVGLFALGKETEPDLGFVSTTFADARADRVSPDPTKPFFGCKLPNDIIALDFVSSDARALEWHHRRIVTWTMNPVLVWLENGATSQDSDFSETALEYDDGGDSVQELSARELFEATLELDGRFTLKDGREFYLIDESNLRWAPTIRAY